MNFVINQNNELKLWFPLTPGSTELRILRKRNYCQIFDFHTCILHVRRVLFCSSVKIGRQIAGIDCDVRNGNFFLMKWWDEKFVFVRKYSQVSQKI